MKNLIAIAAISTLAFTANAQNQANQTRTATQTTNLALSNAIEITFTATDKEVGSDVDIYFNTVNDYANGVESAPQQLIVRSNKDFTVGVKTNSKVFSYTGKTIPAPEMQVKGVLGLMVTDNSTGGEIASPFSSKEYATLYAEDQKLIVDGKRGGKQVFGVQYKATPEFEFPAGLYSVDVVYTATQQ